MAWLMEQAVQGTPGQNFWWIAPTYSQARIPFRRIKRGLPPAVYVANESELTLTLANGTVLWFKGGDNPDALYGEDVYAAVIDEGSRVKEETFHAVRTTLTATRGPLRIIGNVKGRRNWFYALARRAESGEPDMAYARITAHDAVAAGVLDAAEVEDARRVLPDHVFRELYLAEASDDGGNPFGLDAIAACVAPLSPDEPSVFGIDLAKSVDWTVAIGLDAEGTTARLERFQRPWQQTVTDIHAICGRTPALVDSTGVGDPIVEALQSLGWNQYEGFHFSPSSKQQLMEGLALAIGRREVAFPDGVIRLELEAFEYVYTRTGVRYEAPPGMHDDCVMALALAVRHRAAVPSQGVW
jgi:phage FluMu gp28-like protein